MLYAICLLFGWDPAKTWTAFRAVPRFFHERSRFKAHAEGEFPMGRSYPCLSDRTDESGALPKHYFYQDIHVARRIFERHPVRHIDIGSRVDGFIAHLASFRDVEVIDIRPLTPEIPHVTFMQADFSRPLPPRLLACCDSASCLHALEHFGLGRYGDPIDASAWRQGLANLVAMLKPGGTLYLSVPIGPQRVEFNAHRVFSVAYVLECLAKDFSLDSFSFIDDDNRLHADVAVEPEAATNSFGCQYGCGIFIMTRRGATQS